MKNDNLNQVWNSQRTELPIDSPEAIVSKAKKQRRGQFLLIGIISITVLILILYAVNYATLWNDFTLGLCLMISALVFRMLLEFLSLYQRENKLVTLDHRSFRTYLRNHYRMRLGINYAVTPLCMALYIIGFLKLIPYFEAEFSPGFYMYILFSGIISLLVLVWIITRSIIKENRFLKHINSLL